MFTYSPHTYRSFVSRFLKYAHPVKVGSHDTYEIINTGWEMKNVRDRVITEKWRRMNIGFAVAEWLAFMTGRGDVDFFTPHIATYGDDHSVDGVNVTGAYGPINWPRDRDESQLERAIKLLRSDPHSRRAVVTLYSGERDLYSGMPEVPCTLSMQFLVRNRKLFAIVNMRSNDIYRGVTYDAFLFSMVAEYVARQLEIAKANVVVHTGSLHLYDSDLDVITSAPVEIRYPHNMKPMPVDVTMSRIRAAADVMSELSVRRELPDESRVNRLGEYLANLVWISYAVALRRDAEAARRAYYNCHDTALRRTARRWLEDRGVLSPFPGRRGGKESE